MKKLGFIGAFLLLNSFLLSSTSLALNFNASEVFPSWNDGTVEGVVGTNSDMNFILQYVPLLINIMMKIIAPIVLVVFILAGIRFISANGNDDDLQKAKALFKQGVLGLVCIAISYSVIKAIYFLFAPA